MYLGYFIKSLKAGTLATKKIKIGTRSSELALWQANHIAELLASQGFETEIVKIETKGDKILSKSIAKIGTKGVFTQELEEQILAGEIDIAVHSAKDMPSLISPKLELIAYTERENACDVVVSFNHDLRMTSKQKWLLGTASTRRVAMIRSFYNMQTINIRGNLQTRMRKLEEGHCDALILAYAGVKRMNYEKYIVEYLPTDKFTPPTGQASIVVEASAKMDKETKEQIRNAVNHELSEARVLAERSFLTAVEGGCSIPTFAFAEILADNTLQLNAGVVSSDGKKLIREIQNDSIENAVELGKKIAKIVLESGGEEILEKYKK